MPFLQDITAMPVRLGDTVMRKLEIADPEVVRIAIRQQILRSDESRYNHRLHGLLLVTGGHTCQQVAELFGEDRRTVQRWVKTFEQHGLDGLREGERPGRPRTLSRRQWQNLENDLRRNPDEFGLIGRPWNGKLLSAHLQRHYGTKLGVRQCQRILKQMGFRCQNTQPQLAQTDPLVVRASTRKSIACLDQSRKSNAALRKLCGIS